MDQQWTITNIDESGVFTLTRRGDQATTTIKIAGWQGMNAYNIGSICANQAAAFSSGAGTGAGLDAAVGSDPSVLYGTIING